MSRTRRQKTRHALAAITLAAPAVVFASPSPTTVQKQEAPETRPVLETASAHEPANPMKGALLRAVVESLSQQHGRGQEASPFEPPGKPPGRPPDTPGHHNPPNPPGQPPDRPPVRPDH